MSVKQPLDNLMEEEMYGRFSNQRNSIPSPKQLPLPLAL